MKREEEKKKGKTDSTSTELTPNNDDRCQWTAIAFPFPQTFLFPCCLFSLFFYSRWKISWWTLYHTIWTIFISIISLFRHFDILCFNICNREKFCEIKQHRFIFVQENVVQSTWNISKTITKRLLWLIYFWLAAFMQCVCVAERPFYCLYK